MDTVIGFNLICLVVSIILVFTINWEITLKEKIIFITGEIVILVFLVLGAGMLTNWQ